MRKEQKTIDVYVSNDGKEFLTEKECTEYEDVSKHIKYYCVYCDPDLTETGIMQHCIVVAVYSSHGCHSDIVMNWCVEEKGMAILMESVQGWGFQQGFYLSNQSSQYARECWDNYKKGERVNPESSRLIPVYYDKVFLSPIKIDGFPENFNYMEKWGFR